MEIHHEVYGSGPPLLYISGPGNDPQRCPVALLPVTSLFEMLAYDQRNDSPRGNS